MIGLIMRKEYIIDILEGRTTFDTRLYSSDVRGKIGLIESNTDLLYGFVEMVDVHSISYEDYVRWHISDNYDLDIAREKLKNEGMLNHVAYAYDFIKPERLDAPIIIYPTKRNRVWAEFDLEKSNRGFIQESLF